MWDETLEAVRRLADAKYPEHGPVVITIDIPGGPAAVLRVCAGVGQVRPARGDPIGLSDMEQAIIDVLTEADTTLTGEEIAEQAEYAFGGTFKATLARLESSRLRTRCKPLRTRVPSRPGRSVAIFDSRVQPGYRNASNEGRRRSCFTSTGINASAVAVLFLAAGFFVSPLTA